MVSNDNFEPFFKFDLLESEQQISDKGYKYSSGETINFFKLTGGVIFIGPSVFENSKSRNVSLRNMKKSKSKSDNTFWLTAFTFFLMMSVIAISKVCRRAIT